MAAYHRVYDSVTCKLIAKNWDQLWNSTLGNRVWATFTFFTFHDSVQGDDGTGAEDLLGRFSVISVLG